MAAAVAGPVSIPSPSEGGRHALLDDTSDDNPLYRQDLFRMYCLKVLPCSKRYCHDWTTCPFAHPGEKAKRRDPRIYTYTGVACPEMKKNNHCPAGDKCVYAHSVWEYWLHSSRYRTQLCNDGVSCKRKICFFAHTLEELRVSSVKVLSPEAARLGEGFELDPFAPSAPSNGSNTQGGGGRQGGVSQRKGGHLGNRPQMVRHGMANGSHFSNGSGMGSGHQVPGFSMADLQQLTQLQAKLQAATGMGSLGALPAQLMQQQQRMGGLGPGMMPGMTDPAAAEHLMHQLMQQQQHQSHHQQPQQQTEVMQIMAGALPSQPQQHQQQQQQAATAAASAAMAAAAHGQQAGHTPAAVAAAAAHMQMLQNGGLPALPGSMEAQQQQQQQQQLAGTTAGSLSAGVMGVHGGVLAQQQHAATLAGVGGLRGVVRNPNGMVPSLEGGATGPGAFLHGPLNMHNVGGGGRRGSNSSSGRPGVSTSAPQLHHAPAFGMGLPHDQQHTAPDALLAQQFAGLGVNGGLGGMVPFPHFALAPSHSNIGMASSLYSSSSGFAGTAAAATHGAFGGGPTFRRQRSLPPPHAVRVPIAQGAGRSTSLQQPAHLRTQQQQQQQQHGGGDTSLAAHSLPPQALRRGSSGKHSSMLDPGSGSLVPSNSMMAIPSAAVLQSAGSAPTQMPRPRSREAAAGASPFFGSNSLGCAGSDISSSPGHMTPVEGVAYAEEAAPFA